MLPIPMEVDGGKVKGLARVIDANASKKNPVVSHSCSFIVAPLMLTLDANIKLS